MLAGDRVLGRVTSGGYGYTVGRNIFCAYVATDQLDAAEYTIEVMGERHPRFVTRGRCTIPIAARYL